MNVRRLTYLKRLLVAVGLAYAIVLAATGAVAGSGSGIILVGHPGTLVKGVTEGEFTGYPNRCTRFEPRSQGVDGYVIDLGADTQFKVAGTPAIGPDTTPFSLNVTFYSAACFVTGVFNTSTQNPALHSWTGVVPSSSRWAIVSLAYGADVRINWNACTPPQGQSCAL